MCTARFTPVSGVVRAGSLPICGKMCDNEGADKICTNLLLLFVLFRKRSRAAPFRCGPAAFPLSLKSAGFQHLLHFVQVFALGGVQAAHLVVGGRKVRHHHGDKVPGGTGAHAVVTVLQHKGAVTRSAQRFRCSQKISGSGLEDENCSPETITLK